MTYTVSEIISFEFPQMDTATSKQYYIDSATLRTDATYFGDTYNLAIALRAIHEYILANDPARKWGTAGLLTGKTEGRLSLKFWNSVNDKSSSNLNSTVFGQRLRELIRSLRGGALIGNPNVGA